MEAVQGCIRWGGGGAVWQNVGERMNTEKPVWPEEEGSQEGGGQSTEEYGGRTVPKA